MQNGARIQRRLTPASANAAIQRDLTVVDLPVFDLPQVGSHGLAGLTPLAAPVGLSSPTGAFTAEEMQMMVQLVGREDAPQHQPYGDGAGSQQWLEEALPVAAAVRSVAPLVHGRGGAALRLTSTQSETVCLKEAPAFSTGVDRLGARVALPGPVFEDLDWLVAAEGGPTGQPLAQLASPAGMGVALPRTLTASNYIFSPVAAAPVGAAALQRPRSASGLLSPRFALCGQRLGSDG